MIEAPSWARTWLEYWPAPLRSLSFRQHGVPLDPAQTRALGRRNGLRVASRDEPREEEGLGVLENVLDCGIAALGGRAFVRLGSRSPKDTPLAVLTGGGAASGAEALRLLCGPSRRLAFDLRRAVRHGLAPWVFLREWHDIPWWAEYRCFLRDGALVGISQYHTGHPLPQASRSGLSGIRAAIARLMREVLAIWGEAPVVADVWADASGHAMLIELNPWGPPTEPAFFCWQRDDFDGSLRIGDDHGVPAF